MNGSRYWEGSGEEYINRLTGAVIRVVEGRDDAYSVWYYPPGENMGENIQSYPEPNMAESAAKDWVNDKPLGKRNTVSDNYIEAVENIGEDTLSSPDEGDTYTVKLKFEDGREKVKQNVVGWYADEGNIKLRYKNRESASFDDAVIQVYHPE